MVINFYKTKPIVDLLTRDSIRHDALQTQPVWPDPLCVCSVQYNMSTLNIYTAVPFTKSLLLHTQQKKKAWVNYPCITHTIPLRKTLSISTLGSCKREYRAVPSSLQSTGVFLTQLTLVKQVPPTEQQ